MEGKVLHYFAGGNTAKGFYSLYDSNFQHLDRLFILKGGPGTGKSTFMKKIGQIWNLRGFDTEYLHCSSDNDSIDGVIIPKLKVGVVDGTAPHVIEPKAPGAIEDYVNLGEAWDSNLLSQKKDAILSLNAKINEAFHSAYSCFGDALRIHDSLEKIYIENMDFAKADELAENLIEQFFGSLSLNKTSTVVHRYLGAATPKGAVDFVPNLTGELGKRYFIKGRAGTGKSTLLKKLAQSAEAKGLDVEVYHCGFDPNSLDMLIFREIGIAIFDSTAPHEYFPERTGDEIIDMYDLLVTPGTDEKYADEIENLSTQYKNKMTEGISCLSQAKSVHDELEKYYIDAMDFSIVDRINGKIIEEIDKIEGKFL
ncbi:PRK06851 family protein [Bacillus litorisediminis]|uniref:PRK06851 family protein n=1 Tax=Bacillus litorisediminis TaxID=2922713 RepID=UPI001FAD80C4|nr:PRK06851 family protein [Bacillus litorisediminis]